MPMLLSASSGVPATGKRPADESSQPDSKVSKKQHGSTPSSMSTQIEEKSSGSMLPPGTGETVRQRETYIQVGKYLMEQFSIPGFRSHATVGLVDRDRIQFYHANHSVILVSSAIGFGKNGPKDGLDKLIAIVIAFSRLSLRENGILHNLLDGRLFQENEDVLTSKLSKNFACIQTGRKLEFGEDRESEAFTLTFGNAISREPSLVGRSTTVLHATSPQCKKAQLVVKISWPGAGRTSETDFLREAIKKARDTPGGWALNHLPGLRFAKDISFGPDSTRGKVASLFSSPEFVNGGYVYEERTLRIIVQDRLFPLKTLTNARDVAQVLLDVLCSTCFSLASIIVTCLRSYSSQVVVRRGRDSAP